MHACCMGFSNGSTYIIFLQMNMENGLVQALGNLSLSEAELCCPCSDDSSWSGKKWGFLDSKTKSQETVCICALGKDNDLTMTKDRNFNCKHRSANAERKDGSMRDKVSRVAPTTGQKMIKNDELFARQSKLRQLLCNTFNCEDKGGFMIRHHHFDPRLLNNERNGPFSWIDDLNTAQDLYAGSIGDKVVPGTDPAKWFALPTLYIGNEQDTVSAIISDSSIISSETNSNLGASNRSCPRHLQLHLQAAMMLESLYPTRVVKKILEELLC